jgi:hypothetical protein
MAILTCGSCHFLRKVPLSADNPAGGGFICRRHPKQVSIQFIRAPQPPQRKRQVLELPNDQQAEAVAYQMAIGQANPTQAADEEACGDFADATGRGYWVCYHEAAAKERYSSARAKQST